MAPYDSAFFEGLMKTKEEMKEMYTKVQLKNAKRN